LLCHNGTASAHSCSSPSHWKSQILLFATSKMRCMGSVPLFLLLLSATSATLLSLFLHTVHSPTCPYAISPAAALIPRTCYANYIVVAANVAPPTNYCWYAFAAYIFAAVRYANATGDAFLPTDTTSACACAFAAYLLHHGLVHPNLILTTDRCNIDGHDPACLAVGKRACQYPTVADIRSPVNFSSGMRTCSIEAPDLMSDQCSCTTCKDSVVAIMLSLLQIAKSKEFVSCGMATTIGIWSPSPEIGRLGMDSRVLSPPPLSSTHPKSHSKHRGIVKITATSAAARLLSVVAVVVLFFAIRKRIGLRSGSSSVRDSTSAFEFPLPKDGLYIFTKSELKQATNGYDPSQLLGQGGSGKVYLGKLPSSQHAAVKRIQRKKRLGEFYQEVEILAKLRHRNLTTLLSYCRQGNKHVLRWVEIVVDVAKGLAYLHKFPGGAVLHRDVKPMNKLLNDDGLAKPSDFGVSKILPSKMTHVSTALIKGTCRYLDPECLALGHMSEALDVYSFGVLISGRKAVVPTESGGAESIAYSAHEVMRGWGLDGEELDLGCIVDERLGTKVDRDSSVRPVFKVAYRCVQPYRNERPKMREVLEALRRALAQIDSEGPTRDLEALNSDVRG
ncbi:hypothetical protein ACLOJK_012318, partial [Asimina triloba]